MTSSQTSNDDPSYTSEATPQNIEVEEMPFARSVSSHGYCFICQSKSDLHDVTFEARIQVFVKRRIFIPKRNRCCSIHTIKNRFYESEVGKICIYSNISLVEITELSKFMDVLSVKVDSQLFDKIADFFISDDNLGKISFHFKI